MSNRVIALAAVVSAAMLSLMVTACNPAGSSAGNIVVVDLAKVAEKTGRADAVGESLKNYQEEIRGKLTDMEAGIQSQIKERQGAMGKKPSQQEVQEFQKLVLEAQRRLQAAGNEAQQVVAARQKELMESFIDEVRPVAKQIALQRGARIVMARGNHLIEFDGALDITEEVIKQMPQKPAAAVESKPDTAEPPADGK